MTEPSPIQLFKQVFRRLTAESRMPLEDLYSEDIVFDDPFHHVQGRDALAQYFRHLNSRVVSAEFEFEHQVVGPDSAALTWRMTVVTRRPRRTMTVPGVSVVRFGDRIVSQRDYFDAGALVYEQVPVLGGVIRLLKRAAG